VYWKEFFFFSKNFFFFLKKKGIYLDIWSPNQSLGIKRHICTWKHDNSKMGHEFIVELSNAKLCGAWIPYIYIYIYIYVLWRWKQEPTTSFCESTCWGSSFCCCCFHKQNNDQKMPSVFNAKADDYATT
jgi:hypothetical protein